MTNPHAGVMVHWSLVLIKPLTHLLSYMIPVKFCFICQLDRVTGYPDIRSGVLAVSIKVFLIGLTFKPCQADYSANVGGAYLVSGRIE